MVSNNKLRKRVSFASSPQSSLHESGCDLQPVEKKAQHVATHSCHYYCDGLDKDERKAICWYTPEDLQPCREEAKDAIQQLQSSLEQGTLDLLDEENVCLRGIEKYADAAGKYRKQRIYIESILQQQRAILQNQQPSIACGAGEDAVESLANLSRYLSQASIEIALFYAGRCAAELSLLRYEEEEEEVEEDDEDEEYCNEDSSCSSQMDVHEPKVTQVCVDPSLSSRNRKRSRCHAFGDVNIPPRKIQCCEWTFVCVG